MADWTTDDMPSQVGRTVVVTGSTTGLGLHTAIAFAERGARVLLANRPSERADAALRRVRGIGTAVDASSVELDLASPDSVREAADEIRDLAPGGIDVLINNAGVMAPPLRITAEGFESQWATNVLGPVALTWMLLPLMRDRAGARVVTVSSLAHRSGDFDPVGVQTVMRGHDYRASLVYSQTKLADLVFARQLDRRLRRAGWGVRSVAAHPGIARSQIAAGPVADAPVAVQRTVQALWNAIAQPTHKAVWPILFAATFPGVRGGYFIGPRGPFALRGKPTASQGSPRSRDEEFAAEVWELLERTTGVTSPV